MRPSTFACRLCKTYIQNADFIWSLCSKAQRYKIGISVTLYWHISTHTVFSLKPGSENHRNFTWTGFCIHYYASLSIFNKWFLYSWFLSSLMLVSVFFVYVIFVFKMPQQLKNHNGSFISIKNVILTFSDVRLETSGSGSNPAASQSSIWLSKNDSEVFLTKITTELMLNAASFTFWILY